MASKNPASIIYSENYEKIIKPFNNFNPGFSELWNSRELFLFFVWREIKIRYKQTYLGLLWVILQPVIMMTILVLFFSKGLKMDTDGMPASLFYLSGWIYWYYFLQSAQSSAQSVIYHSNVIKKVYFPRIILPSSSVFVAAFDFLICCSLLISLIFYHQYLGKIDISFYRLIPGILIAFFITTIFSLGAGMILAALNVKFRDVRYALPFMLQSIFFITPVIFSSSGFNNKILTGILALNPLNASIYLIRSILKDANIDFILILMGTIISVLFLFAGLYIFRRAEHYLSDIV